MRSIFALVLLASTGSLQAMCQQATDSAAQASPTTRPAAASADDAAVQASPVTGAARTGHGGLAANAAIALRLVNAVDSSHLHNGQMLAAKLTGTVRAGDRTLGAGTPVLVTVVATVPAGKLSSAGEISLEVVRVGHVDVFTDVQTFRGEQGHRDVADSAPAKGSDARLDAGARLTFHVQAQATMASGPPESLPVTPGSVNGTAKGAVTPK